MYRKRVTLLVGHFGSGKTEIALNGALDLAAAGERTTLADLDVVKPYFRSRSARAILSDAGIELLAPTGANVHADLPIIVPQIRSHLRDPNRRVMTSVRASSDRFRMWCRSTIPTVCWCSTSVVRRPLTPKARFK